MLLRLLCAASLSLILSAALLDRLVITVGPDVVTEMQLEEEIAVTAFLNHEPIQAAPAQRAAAAHRLVQQTLIRHDMALARFPEPDSAQVERALRRIVDDYGSTADYEAALKQYGITTGLLRAHVKDQIATLRFIEYRFRPELNISEDDLHTEYNRRATHWKEDHPGQTAPDYETSRSAMRSELMEQRTDKALDDWLNQTATQERVVYLDPKLRPAK